MPSIEELQIKLQKMREAIQQKLPDIALTMCITAKAIAERNIRGKGFGAKYSENKVPAWFFVGKELNGSGTSFLESLTESKKKGKGKKKREDITEGGLIEGETTWGEFRGAQGLQNQFVDLGYTNKMWADMSPVEIKQEGGQVVAYLGGRTRENQDKMNYNRDRYGDFISKGLGEEAVPILAQVAIDEVIAVIEQF